MSTPEIIAEDARNWRNHELQMSDFIVAISDHAKRADYITYRAALRAWPASSDFPATRPELGE